MECGSRARIEHTSQDSTRLTVGYSSRSDDTRAELDPPPVALRLPPMIIGATEDAELESSEEAVLALGVVEES